MIDKFDKIEWNDKTYDAFLHYLIKLEDEEYRKFHSSLVQNTRYKIIGIRVPTLRKIASGIAKTNIEDFLDCAGDTYYEEVFIQGIVISYIKDEKSFYSHMKKYVKKIDNWALCDSFCNSIKIVKDYEGKYFKEAMKLALDKDEFVSRAGIVIILNHFIDRNNLNRIFDMLNQMKSDKFYVNMAQAWLISEMYIKYPGMTKEFLKSNNLNDFTQNKAISKIKESFRANEEEKKLLNDFKRNREEKSDKTIESRKKEREK